MTLTKTAGLSGTDQPMTHARLPRWGPAAIGAISLALVCGGLYLTDNLSIPLAAFLTLVLYAITLTVTARIVEGRRQATDRLVTTAVYTAFGLALIPLITVAWTVLSNGFERFGPYFLTTHMTGVFGGMDAGGAYHAIVGTLMVTGAAALISIPIGLLAAIYLVEYGRGLLARAITFFVDVMTGIPSIVAGLFAYALFVIFFGPGVRMGIAGAVALSVLMIPVVVRSTEEMLRIVPHELREASYALGVPKWLTIVKVVIPTSLAGIAAGVTLAIARVIGETAPLLLVAGDTTGVNFDLGDGRMMTLPVYIWTQYRQGLAPSGVVDINYQRAWAAALTLVLTVMALNLIARLISRIFAPKTRG